MRHRGRLIRLSLLLTAALCASCRQQPRAEKDAAPAPQAATPQVAFNGPPGYPPPVVGKPYQGTGVVVLVNLEEGWLEINHEEIKDLMPPMQMEWSVKDRSLLKLVRAGDRVDFTVVETGGGEVITELKRVPQSARP